MNNNESGSLYDQFSGMEAPQPQPQPQKKVREVNWQSADNARREEAENQSHIKDAMRVEQKNLAEYEFMRLAFGHKAIDSFGAMVGEKFGKVKPGFDFKETRDTYISFYKQELDKL